MLGAAAVLGAAVLTAGWYPDPYRRWKARYWDGYRWTERVAKPGRDAKVPVFGHDAVTSAAGDVVVVGATVTARVEALLLAELARLRADVDTWREVADQRAQALDNALAALKSLAAGRNLSTEPAERRAESVETSAWQATIPVAVRIAALSELQSIELKRRRGWWQKLSAHVFASPQRARSDRRVRVNSWPVLGALPYARPER